MIYFSELFRQRFKQSIRDAIQKKQEGLKTFLLDQMNKSNIKKWETENIIVTYIASSTRTTVDSKRLKEEMPEIFIKYQKESEIKPSLKIKIK